MVSDTDSVLRIWKEHFPNCWYTIVAKSTKIPQDAEDDIKDTPDQDEIMAAINRLKNNKAASCSKPQAAR